MTERGKQRLWFWIPAAAFLAGLFLTAFLWQRQYQRTAEGQIEAFCQAVVEQHPELEEELVSSLKNFLEAPVRPPASRENLFAASSENLPFLEQYGYKSSDFGKAVSVRMAALAVSAGLLALAVYGLCAAWDRRKRKGRLTELTEYLEQVNTGAPGTLIQEKEDEYSGLQDEIYKTVTNLYATREEALKARQSFADNLANIAHQLKTPLTAADLSLQLMESSAPDPRIRSVRRQLGRLNELEEALLTLAGIDAGTLELKKEPVDVYTALCLAAENLQELMDRAGVRTEIADRGCVEFTGDLEWSVEALMNLLKNCMEHSPEGGIIFCGYSENPLYTEIYIRDQGPGFAAEDLPRLFERFYRGKSGAAGGAGIGLALSRALFEMQNGSLTARNLPDGGACFEIRIYSH